MNFGTADLFALFSSLKPPLQSPADNICFSAFPLVSSPSHHIGKDEQGNPALLIAVKRDVPNTCPAPIALKYLTVQHDVECRLEQPDGVISSGYFSVIRCLGHDKALQEYFIRAVTPVILKLPEFPSQNNVVQIIGSLIELFRLLTIPPRKTIQGLWAELFVILQSSDPVRLISSWHTIPEERYDFCAGTQRLEVKSAAGRFRRHHFSLEQLKPIMNINVLVASLFVEHATGGYTVFDLVEELRVQVSKYPKLLTHIDQIVGATLGSGWRQANESHFDWELAADSLRFYKATDIPSVPLHLPSEVTDVHFRADLSRARITELPIYSPEDGIFQALHRRK